MPWPGFQSEPDCSNSHEPSALKGEDPSRGSSILTASKAIGLRSGLFRAAKGLHLLSLLDGALSGAAAT